MSFLSARLAEPIYQMTAMRGKLRFLPFCKLAATLRRSKARVNSDSKLNSKRYEKLQLPVIK
jgi:hypothetical protein